MRFATYRENDQIGVAVADNQGRFFGRLGNDPDFPGSLSALLAKGTLTSAASVLLTGSEVDLDASAQPPLLAKPGKLLCVGLNYADHARETGLGTPTFPALFARFANTLVGHGEALVKPAVSDQFDYEGELAVIIGRRGRAIDRTTALDHVAGYSIFNDASVRDYQLRTSQWLAGKTFDATGGFGPVLVTPDELPAGGCGLRIQTRLNGVLVQDGTTEDLIFDIQTLISTLSVIMTLEPGDVIITGTPAGVGMGRQPPLWMKAGDTCHVTIEGIGTLRNPIITA